MAIGETMHGWIRDLLPIPRSLTGEGVRRTLAYLGELLPDLTMHEVSSGTVAFDWTVPPEWTVREAWIADVSGTRIVDWAVSPLHLVGYSVPFRGQLTRAELEPHLHSAPDLPDAIPYVTSYYTSRWGFCLSHRQREALGAGPFTVVVDTTLAPGSLTYAEVLLPGRSEDEVMFSTYVCHPAMANNELSGPTVLTALAQDLAQRMDRWYTYRFLFAPETIGSLAYLATHLEHLQQHVRAGWVISCVGDERTYSHVMSRLGGNLADDLLLEVLLERGVEFTSYPWAERGSDERQFSSPGIDLPFSSFCRSKYAEYPEYHTSLDDLSVVTPLGLAQSLAVLTDIVNRLESRPRYRAVYPGEPMLGRRGLYPTIGTASSSFSTRTHDDVHALTTHDLTTVLSYCDGDHDAVRIARRTGLPLPGVTATLEQLSEHDLVVRT